MIKKNKFAFYIFLLADAILIAVLFFLLFNPPLHFGNFDLLTPKGIIALKQKNLLITVTLVMLVIVIPVFVALFYIVWKYNSKNSNDNFSFETKSDLKKEILLWIFPTLIIFIISIINWKSAHDLDPYKPLISSNKPITIQVVALRWKWLFIYPEYNIATVNFIEFPQNTPLNFELTADDAPMNSIWIPQLGGQMYAMAGMSTKLHLMANQKGEFNGSAADISGIGFSGMRFIAKATSEQEFNEWLSDIKESSSILDKTAYQELLKPSENNPPAFYLSTDEDFYNRIVMKYMEPVK